MALERMHPDKLDRVQLMSLVEKYGYSDVAAALRERDCPTASKPTGPVIGRNNPFGSMLNAIFSSDIGHFDVIDMRHPLPEAYELVEDGHITADDFRAFTFTNAVKLWGTQNPRFFEGTRVAKEAAAILAAAQTPTLAAAE
jgi:hypothetical protein